MLTKLADRSLKGDISYFKFCVACGTRNVHNVQGVPSKSTGNRV